MDEKDNGIPGVAPQAGRDKRPRVTLDLKATEIADATAAAARGALPPPGENPRHQAGDGAGDEAKPADQSVGAPGGMPEPKAGEAVEGSGAARIILTHTAAGLAGGLLALLAAFYGIEQFRDRMTVLSGITAEQIKAETKGTAARLANLEQTLQSGQLAGIEDMKTRIAAITEENRALAAQLAALTERLANSEKQLAAAPAAGALNADEIKPLIEPLNARVAAAEKKLAALAEAQSSQKVSVAATAFAVAFGNLERAVQSGRAFAAELEAVEALGGASSDIASLAAFQNSGVASPERLEKTLPDFIKTALDAEYARQDGGFFGRLWANTRAMLNIRQKGLVEGDSPEAILARTETRLKAGDVAAAIKEAEGLKGEAAVILRPWLDQARARADASAALDRMEARLLASLKTESRNQ